MILHLWYETFQNSSSVQVIPSPVFLCIYSSASWPKTALIEFPELTETVEEARQYHGIIKEDAQEGDMVELDQDLICRNRNGLTGGKDGIDI